MKEYDFANWLIIYGWVILIIMLVIVGALFFLGVFKFPEKFNHEMHDCTEWKGDVSNCDLSNPIFAGISIQAGDYGMREIICHYGFEGEKGSDFSTATTTHNDTCVSWQPKTPQLNKEDIVEPSMNMVASVKEGKSNFEIKIVPCECCKTNTCKNETTEELYERQCGYAYADYINRSVSESERARAKEFLMGMCNGVVSK